MNFTSHAFIVGCLSIILLGTTAKADDPTIYQVGISKVDITPNYPIRLNGFGNRREESEGVSQQIYARAIAISYGDAKPLVLIAIDNLGVRLDMVDEVAKRLKSSHGVPRENIALTFTHSHCTPKVNGAADNIFSTAIPAAHQKHIDRYTKELTDLITRAAEEAIGNRKASRLEWAIGTVGFAKNRRTPGGPVDHDLPTLFVRDAASNKIRAVYVAYACHCTTLSFNKIHGDWAGYAAESIERMIPGATALVSIGAGSDSKPAPGVQGDKVGIAASQGMELASEVQRLLKVPKKPVTGNYHAALNRIDLPLNPLPTRKQFEEMVKKGKQIGYNATTQLAKLDRGEKLLDAIDYPIQTWSFGESLCVVFLAGEVCVDYSLRLKKEFDRERFWLNAYSNDFCSYIPSERLAREGRYGGGSETPYFALPTTLKAGLEQLIVDEVHSQVPDSFHLPDGTQGVAPRSPEESLRLMQTHKDLKIELVAAEPLIRDPVAIDFGSDGRLWVAEMNDYGHGVYEKFKQHGRIRWLRDTNNDGRFDKAQTFVDGLRFPMDVKVWRDGVLICDAPDILFARDENGDGVADSVKKLFSGFDVRNAQARVNSLRLGLDNWLYGSCGLFGGKITSHLTGKTIDITGRDFRMNPDTGAIEPVTGRTQQGRCRNDWGDWFGCSNGTLLKHYPTEDRYTRRNPYVVPAPSIAGVANAEALRIYPPKDLVLFELSGTPDKATSACGLGIYRDTLLGSQYTGNAFTCEPVYQLVHRIVMEPDGIKFSGRRAENEKQSEFLSSTDKWFRPVQMRTGPDGAIWVVDMYRYVIEHSRWIPQATLAELDIYAGQSRGRIYRILPRQRPEADHRPERPVLPSLKELSDQQLVQYLDHPNGTIRDLVQQMLIWHEAKPVVDDLKKLAVSAKLPQGKIHALATLDGLGGLSPQDVLLALKSQHAEVVRFAIRLAEPLLNEHSDLVTAVIAHASHLDIRVRRQVAWTLGETSSPKAAIALAHLIALDHSNIYVKTSVLSSISSENASAVLAAFQKLPASQKHSQVYRDLVSIAIRVGNESSIATVLKSLTPILDDKQKARELPASSVPLFVTALDTADLRNPKGLKFDTDFCNRVRALHTTAAKVVANQEQSPSQIQLALAILGRQRGAITKQLLDRAELVSVIDIEMETVSVDIASLISARHSVKIQQAAVAALSRTGHSQVAELLVGQLPYASASLHQNIFDVLLSRDEWTGQLLDHIESGDVRKTSFDAARQQRLVTHRQKEIREKAIKIFQNAGSQNRVEIMKVYAPVIKMSGDANKGREVFKKSCSACHRLEGQGHVVGPDLMGLTNHDPKWLLTTILDPNKDVDARYIAWTALRVNGQTATGLLVEETSASIRLRESGGKEHVILRSDLEEIRSLEMSVMPEGLEKEISQQKMADLIAYLSGFRSAPKKFAGNTPKTITPHQKGELRLLAKHAEIRGEKIKFETEYQNIGFWHSDADHVSWSVAVPKPGRFDIYIDASCESGSAGNRFLIDGLPVKITGAVLGTGGWDRYHHQKVGTIELEAGKRIISVCAEGPLVKQALFDLREVRFVPAGQSTQFASTVAGDAPLPRRPPQIAPFLLDDLQPKQRRLEVIDKRSGMGPAIISLLVKGLDSQKEEEVSQRIRWIWQVAIAVGKRNDGGEVRDLLHLCMPQTNQPLQQWQAVVIGGGLINGLTLIDKWPQARFDEIISSTPTLAQRWPRTLELAAQMADNEEVRSGTRYDALRMIALAGWEKRGLHLVKYLEKGVPDELQMGAVSGLSDIPSDQMIEPLIQAIPTLSKRNRKLAFEALGRTESRALALLKAIKQSRVTAQPDELKPLLKHSSESVRKQAAKLLN